MEGSRMLRYRAGALLALVLAGCAAGAALREEPGRDEGGQDRAGDGRLWSARPPAGIPAEAREYLEALSAAFARQDGAWLLAQGEAAWDAEVRPRYGAEAALALLFRSGPWTAEQNSAGQTETLPRLDWREVRSVEYSGWTERGPLLEIPCRLILRGGAILPGTILLVWRLREPKIQGLYP